MAKKEKTDVQAGKEEWKDPAQNPIFRFWKTDKEEKTGDILIGLLVKKNSWTDPTTQKPKSRYTIRDDSGKSWTVFGTTRMDRALENVPENSRIKFEYKGQEATKRGGKAHVFDVKVARVSA